MTGQPTILVVDDDEPLLKLMEALLRTYRMIPVTASSGKQAIELVRSENPDLAIVDLNMPDVSPAELVESMRRASRRSELPMIILSGDPVDEARRSETGIDVAILKPFDTADLIEKIKKELD
ncbi:MAG: response regulator [Acidobacteria bacterium]|nr:response regulator [Acidobacteriota bacterium]